MVFGYRQIGSSLRVALLLFVFTVIVLPTVSSPAWAEGVKKVITTKFHLSRFDEYQEYIRDFDPTAPGPVKAEGLDRHLAEAIIFTIAPVIGGCDCEIVLEPFAADTTFIRVINEVSAGRLQHFPIAAFEQLVDGKFPNMLLSAPVLEDDEFYVGLYTHEDRTDILSLTDIDEIAKLRFVTAETWHVDKQVILDRDFELVTAENWSAILNLLRIGRGDVVLQPFASAADMSFTDEHSGRRFVPIPGIKMAFTHSRHYMVSELHPQGGTAFLEYLDEGLRIMRQTGRLKEFFSKAGVLDQRIANFLEL